MLNYIVKTNHLELTYKLPRLPVITGSKNDDLKRDKISNLT